MRMKALLHSLQILALLIALATGFHGVSHGTLAPQAVAAVAQKGNPDTKVWVNNDSKVYHCPGTRWYGKTKKGEYMTQKQAQEKGNRPVYGKYCE